MAGFVLSENLILNDGTEIDATELQIRGNLIGYNTLRDPAADVDGNPTATPNYKRGVRYTGTDVFDSVRRDSEKYKYIIFKGSQAEIITAREDGFETARTTITLANTLVSINTMFSSSETRVRPAFMDGARHLHDSEYIIACLAAGFTEHPDDDTTHKFSYHLDPESPVVASIDDIRTHP